MSSLSPIGLSASGLSSVLAAFNGTNQTDSTGSQGTMSLSQLQRILRQQLDQAFQHGSSLADTGTTLADKVSATLKQYGVSDEERNAVVSRLNSIFAQAGSRSEARQNAQQLLDNFVQGLDGATAGSSTAGSPDAGQSIDFTA